MGGSSSTYLLDRVESEAFRLINAPHLTSQLPPLKLRRDFTSLSLFYRYHFGRCSEELNYCVPGPKNWGRSTRLAASSDEFYVEVCNPCIDRYMVSTSFSTEVICGALTIHLFSIRLKIYLLSNIRCKSTSDALINLFFHYFMNSFILVHNTHASGKFTRFK